MLGDMTWLYESIQGNKRWAADKGARSRRRLLLFFSPGWRRPTLVLAEHLELLMVDNPHIDPGRPLNTSCSCCCIMAGEYGEIYPEETLLY